MANKTNKQNDSNDERMIVHIPFTHEELEWLRTKFYIEDAGDLYSAIMECVDTYMEL